MSCQRLKLQDVKFSSKQLATLLRGIGKDKEMKEIELVNCLEVKLSLDITIRAKHTYTPTYVNRHLFITIIYFMSTLVGWDNDIDFISLVTNT